MDGVEYFILMISILMFFIFWRFQTDGKYTPRFFDKTIQENSSLRKFYPFKEKENNPLTYVKLIPYLISIVVLIIVFIIYIIYWINPPLLIDFLRSKPVVIAFVVYFCAGFLYSLIFID